MNKIIKIKNIKNIKSNSQKIVFMSGAFDIMHYGHILALKKASTLGDILIVQIDGNSLVRKRKGKNRPFLDEVYRALLVSSVSFVDYVFISNAPSEVKSKLKAIEPDIFVRAIQKEESPDVRLNREKKLINKFNKMKIYWLKQHSEISTSKILAFGGAKKRSQILAFN